MYQKKNVAHVYPLNEPVRAQINVPGSKSYTNRALIIASLAQGTSTLVGYSEASDSLLLINILQQLGIEIESKGNVLTIKGNGGKFKEFIGKINVEDAGTVMRFLTALCCLIPGEIILEGSSRMHKRPIKGLVDALLQLGADISYLSELGYPPIKIRGGNLTGGKVKIDASNSSQFISALLMIAPVLNSDLEIIPNGELVSAPYIDMTISAVKHFGVSVKQHGGKYFTKGDSGYNSTDYTIEGDASSASYFFALAAITQSTIHVNNLSGKSLQGDIKFIDLLEQMGCKVLKSKDYLEVTGPKELQGIEANMSNMPDVSPTLALVAAFAKGKTVIKGVENLELKESKRLTVLQLELKKMGIICESNGEQIIIHGGNPIGAAINSHNDHRMAMSFAIAGTRIKDLYIDFPEVVNKSFPNFWEVLEQIGVKADIVKNGKNIILIGFMGAGKTTIGRLLAKELELTLLETDDEIVKRSGIKSVNEIFEKKGESFFRGLEKDVISDYAKKSNCVISCGGGVITNPRNMKLLKKNSIVIFLSPSFETICRRLYDQNIRPLFTDKESTRELYSYRFPLYQGYADEVIFTDDDTPEETSEFIISHVLKQHG